MKTIRLYHPHTHEGVAYDPPPEGVALTVSDVDAALLDAWGLTTPPPALTDAPTAPVVDAVTAGEPLAPRHDRRARVAIPTDTDATIPSRTA